MHRRALRKVAGGRLSKSTARERLRAGRSDGGRDMSTITLNGSAHEARVGERLIDVINRAQIELPQVCYHPQLGPVQTCDTCMVEVDGKLLRACAAVVTEG